MKLSKQGLAQDVFSAQAITPGELLIPKKKNEAAVSPRWLGGLIEAKARSESVVPDARRETAQKAAKARWANWANKKAL
jgi:hypothetical protein